MNKFKIYNLDANLIKALDGLKYKEPTTIQNEVIPIVLDGYDLVAQAKTGSGKTASFGIPICDKIDWEPNEIQALILTPTRELALQIKEELSNIGLFKRLKTIAIFGKTPITNQIQELKQKNHICVGTPGRIFDHLERGTINLSNIKYLVIDEADEMFSMGFIDTIQTILNQLPKSRQTMLFSATYPDEIQRLVKWYLKSPKMIKIEEESIANLKILQSAYKVEEEQKFELLKDVLIVENPSSCILFCSTKQSVDTLYDSLRKRGFPVTKLHGGMDQKDRIRSINDFKIGFYRYLVATDVAARGLDIPDVTHVINYDIPNDKETYVHRIGRTARYDQSGKAITLFTESEEYALEQIEEYTTIKITIEEHPSKAKVDLLRSKFKTKLKEKTKLRTLKNADQFNEVTKLFINGGKKKKLRAVDFVGAITSAEGITSDDIGVIDIKDTFTYIDILNGKGKIVVEHLKNKTIKNKQLRVQVANKNAK